MWIVNCAAWHRNYPAMVPVPFSRIGREQVAPNASAPLHDFVAVGISSLNNKAGNHPMKHGAIKIFFLDQKYKISPMVGGVFVELNIDVSKTGF